MSKMPLEESFMKILQRLRDSRGSLGETKEEKLARLAKEALALVITWADVRGMTLYQINETVTRCVCAEVGGCRIVTARVFGLDGVVSGSSNKLKVSIDHTLDEQGYIDAPPLWFEITGIDTPRPRSRAIDAPKAE